MSLVPGDIEQIVQRVLERLRAPAGNPPAPAAAAVTPLAAAAQPAPCVFTDAVVTSEMLAERLAGARQILVGPRTIITPAARDFLRAAGVTCTKQATDAAAGPPARWKVLYTQAGPGVQAALDHLPAAVQWERQLSGTVAEVVSTAVSALCRAEADGVVVLTPEPDRVACLANRHSNIRAAVIATAATAAAIRQSLSPNLVAIDAASRSVFEIRNLLRTIVAAGRPAPPPHWG